MTKPDALVSLFTEAEAAARYGIHVRTLRRRIAAYQAENPEFQPMRPGRGMVFDDTDLRILEAMFRRRSRSEESTDRVERRSATDTLASLRRRQTKRLLSGLR